MTPAPRDPLVARGSSFRRSRPPYTGYLPRCSGPQRCRARPDDHGALLRLWERSVRATHHFLGEQDILSLRPLVAHELATDALEWWVLATDTDLPVGFLGYTRDVIEALFIDAAYQGQGGGTLLIEHAAQLSTGPLSVEVNEQNPAAVGFYRAQGFEVISRSDLDAGGRPFPLLRMRRGA